MTLDREGAVCVHRGLLREAEAKALRVLERTRNGEVASADAEGVQPATAGMSGRLALRLSAHRTAALQTELARHPHVALAAVAHGMVWPVLQRHSRCGESLPLGMHLTVQHGLHRFAPDCADAPATAALRELQQAWSERLPTGSEQCFVTLLAMPQDELVQLIAVCAASTVDVVTQSAAPDASGALLAEAVGLDMASWWKPTAEGFFAHLAKAPILDAVRQFAPAEAGRLAKLKKKDLAAEAERLVQGTGWLPAVFAGSAAPDAEPDAEDEDEADMRQGGDDDGADDDADEEEAEEDDAALAA